MLVFAPAVAGGCEEEECPAPDDPDNYCGLNEECPCGYVCDRTGSADDGGVCVEPD
jgi:hypothetical protein